MMFLIKLVALGGAFLLLAGMIQVLGGAPQRSAEADRQALVDIETDWLNHEHDASALERILASDFIHPVVTGDFLNKSEHIFYSGKFRPPDNVKRRFDGLKVRIYGDVGIVNGIVIQQDETGKELDRSIFTDVFLYRDRRWQAVNAQENKVQKLNAPRS